MNAAEIAKTLKGHRSGDGFLCRCPVPSHGKGKGDRRPSLLVKDGDTNLLVTCFGGCGRRDVIDTLRREGLLGDGRDSLSGVSRPPSPRGEATPPRDAELHIEPDAEALVLWQRARPIRKSTATGRKTASANPRQPVAFQRFAGGIFAQFPDIIRTRER